MRFILILIIAAMPLAARDNRPSEQPAFDKTLLSGPFPKNDPWLARDKAQHFFGSFFITGLNIQLLQRNGVAPVRSRQIAAGISFSIGLGKEIRDSRQKNNIFSIPDLIADIAGIGLALILVR